MPSAEARVPSTEEVDEPLWFEALPMTSDDWLLRHWRYFAEPWMTVSTARDALKHCRDCWEIGARVLWVFGVRFDRSRMPE